MTDHSDLVARAKQEAQLGVMAPSQVALVHDLCALIETQAAELVRLRGELAGRDAEIERLKSGYMEQAAKAYGLSISRRNHRRATHD